MGLVKILHEVGHAVCCKAVGGEVREAGALFLVFSPALYCDVSDSWSLPSKWQRIAIAAAGIYVDLLVAAAATFVWWGTDPVSFAHNLCLGLMVVCAAGTLAWNANPLLRFDGYYVLSDWLEVPNLAEESIRHLRAAAARLLGVDAAEDRGPGRSRPFLFTSYALAAYAYRIMVTAAVVYFLCSFLRPYKLGALGFALGGGAFLAAAGWPAWQLARPILRGAGCRKSCPEGCG